jgi:hypothetical protein
MNLVFVAHGVEQAQALVVVVREFLENGHGVRVFLRDGDPAEVEFTKNDGTLQFPEGIVTVLAFGKPEPLQSCLRDWADRVIITLSLTADSTIEVDTHKWATHAQRLVWAFIPFQSEAVVKAWGAGFNLFWRFFVNGEEQVTWSSDVFNIVELGPYIQGDVRSAQVIRRKVAS